MSNVLERVTRVFKLAPFYHRLTGLIEVEPYSIHAIETESAETLVPHPLLREMLQRDPAMAALLPGAAGHFALGGFEHAPFTVLESGLILLTPVLLVDSAALAVGARWGLEAAHVREHGALDAVRLSGLVRYGRELLYTLARSSRDVLLAALPPAIAAELWGSAPSLAGDGLLQWQASLIADAAVRDAQPASVHLGELQSPVERILAAGGDSRLRIDPATRLNCYGVPPRPRPEAVHFSSSTASAVSEYGFLFCELLRRDLLAAEYGGITQRQLRPRVVSAFCAEIAALLGLDPALADVAITPSGTDTELLSVAVARAGAGGRPLTNILVSPEESGRGVRLAGGGRYFDSVAATGARIDFGASAWPDGSIEVREVPIRDARGVPLPGERIDADFLATGRAALADGRHVLAHVLLGSKTGLSAPSLDAARELAAISPDCVDIVVDACQMRTNFGTLGSLVREGWMVQISGSKFLTGPPFSGALVVPAALRSRAPAIGLELRRAPGIGRAAGWPRPGDAHADDSPEVASFGPLFRWLPALLEAELLAMLPDDFRRMVFDRFREALTQRIRVSRHLQPIDVDETPGMDESEVFSRLSIISFQVLGRRWDGSLAPLGEEACRRLFELLNEDISTLLPGLPLNEHALALLQAHVGQPVTLGSDAESVTVLRLVLGARFFNIVGHAGDGATEAALESEIADAKRAVAKIELLASHWWQLECGK